MKYIFLLWILIFSLEGKAQESDSLQYQTIEKRSPWTFGGGIGLGGSFSGSGNGFSAMVAPRVGYKVSAEIETGIMANFSLVTTPYFNSTTLGFGPFATYYFERKFYFSSAFQHYFIQLKEKTFGERQNEQESALFLGGGYMQNIGTNSYLQLGFLYNVLYKENSFISGSALIPSVGIVMGL